MFKKNNLDFRITCVVTSIIFLLNELEEFLTFIVTQIYDLVINNLNTNKSRTFFIDNNNKLVLFNTIFVNIYNLNIELENSII